MDVGPFCHVISSAWWMNIHIYDSDPRRSTNLQISVYTHADAHAERMAEWRKNRKFDSISVSVDAACVNAPLVSHTYGQVIVWIW